MQFIYLKKDNMSVCICLLFKKAILKFKLTFLYAVAIAYLTIFVTNKLLCIMYFILHIKNSYSNTTASGSNRLPEGDEKLYPYLNSNNCDELYTHCPLALLDLSPYTDI